MTTFWRTTGLLTRYVEQVRAFLLTERVVAISAVPTQVSIGPEMKSLRWVKWLAEVAGLNAERADFVPLGTKDEKVTAAAFVSSENGVRRALVLVMGSNRLPGERGRDLLADALRQ